MKRKEEGSEAAPVVAKSLHSAVSYPVPTEVCSSQHELVLAPTPLPISPSPVASDNLNTMGKLNRLELYSKSLESSEYRCANCRQISSPTKAIIVSSLAMSSSPQSSGLMALASPMPWMPFPLYLELSLPTSDRPI